jgi:hypothetical protein
MEQTDDYNKDFTDKTGEVGKDDIREAEAWRNENGQPDFEYLQSLATDGSPESLEKLKSIADDLSVEYTPDTSMDDLIERMRSATAENEDGNPDDTA